VRRNHEETILAGASRFHQFVVNDRFFGVGRDGLDSLVHCVSLALTGTTPDRAAELYYLPTFDSAPLRITDFNASLDALERGKTETITWSSDDANPDGIVTYPPGFTASKKYPLVVYIHGGPITASQETFNPFVQYMAVQGWGIFEPNYRGSDNMGNKFVASIYRDAGTGPGRDVMAGVAMLEKRGFVDSSRMAVCGWSYGGYMTAWLLGHYSVWKAAVAGAAVTDWVNMYSTSDLSVTTSDQVGGSPYIGDNFKSYRDHSPISFARNIHAPTLILHDTGDTRVPIANSYELFRALKDNDVTVQFIAYPVSSHTLRDPIRIRDMRKRWVEWIAKYLGTEAPPESAKKVACALCHGVAILRYTRLSNGEFLAKGKTVTGFANVEEDFADDAVWSMKLLSRDKHVMPWRIEDEMKRLGANYIRAGLWRGFATRDGNLVTGQQNFSGSETAELVIQSLGE
jgi:dienelactone hydrolase